MKNILSSIDFSRHAYNAALYAAELAYHTGARLILFHAYNPATTEDENELIGEVVETEIEAQLKLDNLAHKIKALYNISITRLLKPGKMVEETCYVANKINTDLVVSGVAKTDSKYYPVLDENTTALLAQIKLPVLLVPPKAGFRSYESVYLLLDESEKTDKISNSKFLNKLFFKFRNARLITRPLKSNVPLMAVTEQDSAPELATPEMLQESTWEDLQLIDQPLQLQLLVQTYTSAGSLKEHNETNLISFSEAIPVLLLPAVLL